MSAQTDIRTTDPAPERTDDADLVVARTWHPWRWVTSAAVLIVVAQFIHGLATNPGWDWPTFAQYFTAESVLSALWMTIKLTLWGTLLGFALGVLLAVGRLSNNPVLQVISWTYIWAFRSIPLIVQLLFWFNIAYLYQTMSVGIPFGPGFFEFEVSGVISGFTAAVIGLALHQAAYSAEIIRAGIISVDHGQIEAANALGIPRLRQFFRIVLPQAMRSILPNAANEVISLFKGAQPCAATSGCVTRTARAKESAHHDHHTRSVHRGVAAVALRAS